MLGHVSSFSTRQPRASAVGAALTGGALVVSTLINAHNDDDTHGWEDSSVASTSHATPLRLLQELSSRIQASFFTQHSLVKLSAPCACSPAASTTTADERQTRPSPSAPPQRAAVGHPSWIRRAFHWCRVADLPLPRLVQTNDPALRVPRHLLQQRQKDEARIQSLQQEIQTVLNDSSNTSNTTPAQKKALQMAVADFAKKQYAVMYGSDTTPQERQDFLAKHGCTAWTAEVLAALVQLGQGRGFVEMGAGHGQWARAIEEEQRRRTVLAAQQSKTNDDSTTKTTTTTATNNNNPRDFVLAYDDQSRLPLNPEIYHRKTRPHAAYFGTVHPCPSDPAVILSQWRTRRRCLLLVFPTPALALQSLQAHAAVGPENDTVVYVGEGRGGANAGDEFFDALEQGGSDNGSGSESVYQWVLVNVLPVQPFGSKGFEKLYIFQKQPIR